MHKSVGRADGRGRWADSVGLDVVRARAPGREIEIERRRDAASERASGEVRPSRDGTDGERTDAAAFAFCDHRSKKSATFSLARQA